MKHPLSRIAAVIASIAIVAGTVTFASNSSVRSSSTASSVPLGLFVNSQKAADVQSTAATLGVPVTVSTVFASGTTSTNYPTWADGSLRFNLAVGNLTPSQATAIATAAVANGQANAFVRIMWEQNQDVNGWFTAWNERSYSASAYIAEFQQIVTTMRAVPGQHFVFVWNPDSGNWSGNQLPGRTNEDTWPGSNYVDVIGIDAYDNSSIQSNVGKWIMFAKALNKPIAFPEWGLHNSDDPAFIDWMAQTIASNDTAYQAYFDYKGSIDSWLPDFPNARSAFTKDFSGSIPPPVSTSTTSSTTTTASPSTTTTTTTTPTTTTNPYYVKPVAPSGVTATVTASSVTLAWTNPSNALGNDIYRDGVKIKVTGYPSAPVSSYIDKPTVGTHTYYVTAYDSGGESLPTKTLTVQFPPTCSASVVS